MKFKIENKNPLKYFLMNDGSIKKSTNSSLNGIEKDITDALINVGLIKHSNEVDESIKYLVSGNNVIKVKFEYIDYSFRTEPQCEITVINGVINESMHEDKFDFLYDSIIDANNYITKNSLIQYRTTGFEGVLKDYNIAFNETDDAISVFFEKAFSTFLENWFEEIKDIINNIITDSNNPLNF